MFDERIITIEEVGKAKQCFLNLKSEKTRHILGEVDLLRKENLYKKQTKLRNVLESLILKLTEKYLVEIQSIILFGSYAKDKAVKGSDVDLLFIVSDMRNRGLMTDIERECASFQYSHNIKISPLITNIKEFKKMLNTKELTVGREVREYGIPLYGSEIFWRIVS